MPGLTSNSMAEPTHHPLGQAEREKMDPAHRWTIWGKSPPAGGCFPVWPGALGLQCFVIYENIICKHHTAASEPGVGWGVGDVV